MDGRTLGTHKGIIHYTIGQRRGIGIGGGDPLYVVRLNPETREVIVGPREALATRTVPISEINWLGDTDFTDVPDGGHEVLVKVRSTRPPIPARIHPREGDADVGIADTRRRRGPGSSLRFLCTGWIARFGWRLDRASVAYQVPARTMRSGVASRPWAALVFGDPNPGKKDTTLSLLRTLLMAMLIALPAALPSDSHADEKVETPAEPSAAAMEFVGQFSDAHFTGMLTRIGARQPPLMAMSQLHGQLLAAIYDAEVAKAVKKHGPTWQRNMARAWTALMSEEELNSLRTEGAKSPHTEK